MTEIGDLYAESFSRIKNGYEKYVRNLKEKMSLYSGNKYFNIFINSANRSSIEKVYDFTIFLIMMNLLLTLMKV